MLQFFSFELTLLLSLFLIVLCWKRIVDSFQCWLQWFLPSHRPFVMTLCHSFYQEVNSLPSPHLVTSDFLRQTECSRCPTVPFLGPRSWKAWQLLLSLSGEASHHAVKKLRLDLQMTRYCVKRKRTLEEHQRVSKAFLELPSQCSHQLNIAK